MSTKLQSKVHRKSQNRGRFASFTVHLILLLGAFLPFLSFHAPEEPSKESLVIQFDYPYNEYVAPVKFIEEEPLSSDMASKMSGSEAGGNETEAEPMQSRPIEAAPAPLSSPQVATVVNNTPTPIQSAMSDIPLPMPKIYTHQAWQEVKDNSSFETDAVEEMRMIDVSDGGFGEIPGSGPGDGDDDSSVFSDGFGGSPGGNGGKGNGTGNTAGAGSGPGGGTGSGNAGSKTGLGNDGKGMEWGVGLDGLLNRPLLQRAQVARLAVKEGKIAIYICVDRAGKVVTTKYDVVASTLKDPEFIKKAESCAMSYIFKADETAPVKQCGKLTFIFKIKN